ncbi:zinc finger protein 526 isoform X2 [Hippoglossus stenolepis]|uniref:zinc finger protein 526 isoform X2 n=1 Tax=Hippoglossus stenolepis TaxID=195615 RepID=UPI00159C55F4|nr:zinc finger protein 526 isoform X2 [Hippoglossus stenolepis]
MESCGFQNQLLSVMEVLAKAAVEEINRRVEDSCAVLRLEVNRSRRDIELLKNKCELMEAELRRSRLRARRRGDRCSPLVKVILSKQTQILDWDTQMEAEASQQTQQRADLEAPDEAQHVQIKEECAEEDEWKNDTDDKLISAAEPSPCFKSSPPQQTDAFVDHYLSAEDPAEPGPGPEPEPAGCDTLPPEQQLSGSELVVKHEMEDEPDENEAPLDSCHASVTVDGHDQLWLSGLCRDAADPSFSYTAGGRQGKQIPAVFTPQSETHSEDAVPRTHSAGKSHSVLVRVKRRASRTFGFGCRRPQAEDGLNAQINSPDQSSIAHQSQHQRRDFTPPSLRSRDEDPNPSPAASSLCGQSGRGSFGLARRMRTPWRSGIGEKRFSCTYCDKSFMRFSQLKEHLRSHTGEKPFSCVQCGRSFTKQCNLIRHAVVHSGEKPYECALCGKCFTQRSSLKSHQKTAH